MKFRIFGTVLAIFMVLACGFTVSGEESASMPAAAVEAQTEINSENTDALIARLENMLDHNQVYNRDFDSTNDMVNNSIVALLDRADEDGFIRSDIVEGFVYNMYGITLSEYTVASDFPQKDGHIFVIPRGFEIYDHDITSVEIDGEFVYTDSTLTIQTHEGYTYEYSCRSIFKETIASAFGYNLISCIFY